MTHTTQSWVIANESNRYTDVSVKQFNQGSTQVFVSTYQKYSIGGNYTLTSQNDFTIQELLTFYSLLPKIIDCALPAPVPPSKNPFIPLDENSIHYIQD
jgi:hypothetical protein